MLNIHHAILHAFDFDTGATFLSDHELDLDEKLVKSYVRRHLNRCVSSERNMHGEFAEGSGFVEELLLYLSHRASFEELSKQIAQFLWEKLRTCDDLEPMDLLVADFEQSADAPKGDADEEELERAFAAEPVRRFAVVLLPRSQTFMHSIEHPSGGAFNEIVRHDATLPNPSGKVNTYALVDLMPEQIGAQVFEDEPEMAQSYETEAREAGLPEEVHVRRAAARRLTKTHRIRTDTGIDIAFPSEYSSGNDYIAFDREEDGSLTITIRNVKHIENR